MANFDGVKTKWLNEFLEKNIPLVANLTPDTPNWQRHCVIASIFIYTIFILIVIVFLKSPHYPLSSVTSSV